MARHIWRRLDEATRWRCCLWGDDRWRRPRIRASFHSVPIRPHHGMVVARAGDRRDGHRAARRMAV